jgi:hypothetical protein
MDEKENEFYKTFLNDIERDALSTIADKPTAINALKKVLLADVYFKGTLRTGIAPDPTRNAALSLAITNSTATNEVLGQDVRAIAEGVRLIEGAIGRLEKFKSVKPAPAKRVSGR